jgi:hypothetical protein
VISSHRGAWRICHLHELPDDVQSFSKVCWRIDAKGRTGMLRAVSWDILRVICENAICRHQITHKWILEFFILYKTCLIIHQFCHINPFFLDWNDQIWFFNMFPTCFGSRTGWFVRKKECHPPSGIMIPIFLNWNCQQFSRKCSDAPCNGGTLLNM